MRPLSAALETRLRDAASTCRPIVEARIESAADVRQRADQWQACDGGLPANLEVLADGGLRLKATAGGAVGPTVHTSYYRSFEGGASAPFIDPPSNQVNRTYAGNFLQWYGAAANVSYGQVQTYLNPRFDVTKNKYVQSWVLTLWEVEQFTSVLMWSLRPIRTVRVDAKQSDAAGFILFPFQDATGKFVPFHPRSSRLTSGGELGVFLGYYVTVAGYDAKGNPATNIGWGYDPVATSFDSGTPQVNTFHLEGRPILASLAPGNYNQNSPYWYAALGGQLMAVQFIPVSHAAATTLTFKTGSPVDLLSTPATAPELIGRAEVPPGTSVLYEVAADPAGGFVSFKDGQFTSDPSVNIATQRKYDMRVTLTPSSAGDLTPIVRGLGARVVARTDLGDVAEVVSWNEQTDPIYHKGEVEEITIRAVHDGERDFRDVISQLLSQNAPGKFYFRVFIGDRALPRDQWLHLDDYFPDDELLDDAYAELPCLSCLAFLRQALPQLTSDVVALPIADSSNPGAWTASTGTVLYPQIADATVDAVGGLPDDSTYIQSPSNPVNADYIVNLSAISTPAQAVGATIQFRAATAAGGQSLSLTVFLREGTTVRASRQVTVNVADIGQGSYTPYQYTLNPLTEQPNIGNWSNLNFLIRANGTGQIRVGWARLVVLGLRSPLVYPSGATPGSTVQTVADDLIQNQIALDARYQGPKYTDLPLPLGVGKIIAQAASGVTDLARAKSELDNLAWIGGHAYISSQGQLKAVPLYTVTSSPDLFTGTTTASYAPLAGPVRAIIPNEEIEPIAVTAGWRHRIPLFGVPWGWDGTRYAGEVQVVNQPALSFFAQALIDPDVRCPEGIAQWIQSDGLARGLSTRHAQAFGLGLMVWRFRTTYPRPELERGDVVLLQTDRFLGYDPIANRALSGKLWVLAIVVGRYDVLGREWAVWVQSYTSITPIPTALALPTLNPQSPLMLGVSGYVGEQPGTAAGDNLSVYWAGTTAVQSVKIATSTVSPPAVGAGALFAGRQGVATIVGPFAFGTPIYVTITPYASPDGSGASGVAAQVLKLIDGSSISTPFNSQGSIPPTPVGGVTDGAGLGAIYASGGAATNHMWLGWRWGSVGTTPGPRTLYRPDGTSFSVPWSGSLAMVTPTLSQVAGGALGARTRFVRVALAKNGSGPGGTVALRNYYSVLPHDGEASIAILANNLLKVASPPAVTGYDGWTPLVGTATETEVVQGDPPPVIAFGTDWTEPVGGAQTSSATNTPWASLTWQAGAWVFIGLAASTTFYAYPYYDVASGDVFWVSALSTNSDQQATAARTQYGDGHYALTSGGLLGSTPAAAGTGGGTPSTGGGAGTNQKFFT